MLLKLSSTVGTSLRVSLDVDQTEVGCWGSGGRGVQKRRPHYLNCISSSPHHMWQCSVFLHIFGQTGHRSPKCPKTVLSGGRLREMTWWSQTKFFRDHLYHCYGFYLNRLDTPSSFSLISENQLIFRF